MIDSDDSFNKLNPLIILKKKKNYIRDKQFIRGKGIGFLQGN
jgi:hypothetical protein